jgi:AraC-like DNA-binding protein
VKAITKHPRLLLSSTIKEPDLVKLAGLIRAHTPYDGRFELRAPGVYTIRASRVNTELVHVVQAPALCIIAQGAKRVMLGQEAYEYDPSAMMVYSVDLPLASQVTKASHAEPYLSFRLDLDPRKIAELVLKVFPRGLPRVPQERGACVIPADTHIFSAVTRLIELTVHPDDAEFIAPLVIDEILIRLLRGPAGIRVARIGFEDSGVSGVAKAIEWLRANFSQPVKTKDLAELAHMSVSSFHQHFKSVTSMSPVQYQKALRLQEARRIMLSTMADATVACRQVGYLSPSQFSREYGRFFGSAPTRDIARLREQGLTAADVVR